MFGGKKEKTREIEEKLRQAELLKAEYGLLKNTIKGTKNTADKVFITLESGDAQLDKDLTRLVEAFQKGEIEGQKISEATEMSGSRLEALAELAESLGKETPAKSPQIPEEYRNAAKEAQEASEQMNLSCRAGAEDLEKSQVIGGQLKEITVEMQQSAKNMGVLALSAAIEASRIGDAGKEFVQAAEDIRKLSETYDRAAGEAISKIQELEDSLKQQREQMNQTEKRLKESGETLELLQKEPKEQPDTDGRLQETQLAEGLKEQETAVKEIASRLEGHISLYGDSYRQMEAIGESYMESRKARGELEDGMDKLFNKAK